MVSCFKLFVNVSNVILCLFNLFHVLIHCVNVYSTEEMVFAHINIC